MTTGDAPRVRLSAMPDDGVFVLRGDELDAQVISDDATRFRERFAGWGRYGISAFQAASDDEIDALCQSRLIRFDVVVVFRRADLHTVGIEVVPTFRAPHVTLCHNELERLVAGLRACDHRVIQNPYHVPEAGS